MILFNSLKAGLNLSICPTCNKQFLFLETLISEAASFLLAAMGFSMRTWTPALRASNPT